MDNVTRIVDSEVCTGCGACNICEHIIFKENSLGFFSPVVDARCAHCGRCAGECIYDPQKEDS